MALGRMESAPLCSFPGLCVPPTGPPGDPSDTSQKGQFGDHRGKGFGLRSSTQ